MKQKILFGFKGFLYLKEKKEQPMDQKVTPWENKMQWMVDIFPVSSLIFQGEYWATLALAFPSKPWDFEWNREDNE